MTLDDSLEESPIEKISAALSHLSQSLKTQSNNLRQRHAHLNQPFNTNRLPTKPPPIQSSSRTGISSSRRAPIQPAAPQITTPKRLSKEEAEKLAECERREAARRLKRRKDDAERSRMAQEEAELKQREQQLQLEQERVSRLRDLTQQRLLERQRAENFKRESEKREQQKIHSDCMQMAEVREEELLRSRKEANDRIKLSELRKVEQEIFQEEQLIAQEQAKIERIEEQIAALELQTNHNRSSIEDWRFLPAIEEGESEVFIPIPSEQPETLTKHRTLLKPVTDESVLKESSQLNISISSSKSNAQKAKVPIWKQAPVAVPSKDFYLSQLKRINH